MLAESANDCLQRMGRTIQVVAVQLHGKAAAAAVVHGGVPASAYAKVGTFGHYVYQACVAYALQQFGCAVCGVVVHHDNVELEVRHLPQRTLHGIHDGLFPVPYGNDNRCFRVEILLVEVGLLVVRRVDTRPYGLQMCRGCLFHLHLYLAVTGVHVVELSLSACPCVGLFLGVETLVEVEYLSLATKEQPQVVQSGVAVVGKNFLSCIFVEQTCSDKNHRTEVEIVANAPLLIVYCGVWSALSITYSTPVGIHECRPGVVSRAQQPLKGGLAEGYLHGFSHQQGIFRHGTLRYTGHRCTTCRSVGHYRPASVGQFVLPVPAVLRNY